MSKQGKPRVSKMAAATASAGADSEQLPLFPEPGKFYVKYERCVAPEPVAGKSWEGLRFEFTGIAKDKKLGEVAQLFATNQKALAQSGPRMRSLCRSLIGLTKADDAAFSEFDPHGEFADAIYSNEIETAAEYVVEHAKSLPKALRPADAEEAAERLQNAKLEAIVSKGSDTDDGDWFRNTSFRPLEDVAEDADEDEEDAPDSEEAPKAKASKRKPAPAPADEDEEDEDEDDAPDSEEEAPRGKKKARRK